MPGKRTKVQTDRWRLVVLILIVALLALSGSSFADASTPSIDKAKTEAQALSDLIDQLNA